MGQSFMWRNPGITVEIIDFDGDPERGQVQTNIQLMSGAAPVLIDSYFMDHLNPNLAGFFVDWFPFMDVDPYFNQDDFFMNVLHGAAVNGRLYTFPYRFNYFIVTANRTIPGLAEAMEGYDRISFSQMMKLHHQFPTQTPMLLERDFDVIWGLMWGYIHSFIDIETRRVDFNNQNFVDFINMSRELTSPNTVLGERSWPLQEIFVTLEEESVWSQRYFFQKHESWMFQYFVDFQGDSLFAGAMPLVDSYGKMYIDVYGFLLNAQATPIQQALAWEFVHFISTLEANNSTNSWPAWTQVNKEMHNALTERYFRVSVDSIAMQTGRRFTGTRAQALESTEAQLIAIRELPMTTIRIPRLIENIIREALKDFHFGLVTAEQTAQDLQNRITLVMMEME